MTEEKEVRRGEVWWVASEGSSDWEMNFGRPAVVVSGNDGNEKTDWVIVAFTSSKAPRVTAIFPKVQTPDGMKRVLCNKIFTVKKTRLERKICTLTESEMIRVSGALAVAMCIPQYPAKTVVESPKQPADDTVALRCEIDMLRRMYETVIDQLVEMRVANDLAQRANLPKVEVAPEVVEEPPVVEAVVVVEPAPVVERVTVARESVDINHCSEMVLREMGLSEADCDAIIGCRPFVSVLELYCVPDIDTKWVTANEHRFICTPVGSEEPVKKVNLNTCGGRDLIELGMSSSSAYKITSYRNRKGPFAAVEDLMKIHGIGQRFVDTWADKLEV